MRRKFSSEQWQAIQDEIDERCAQFISKEAESLSYTKHVLLKKADKIYRRATISCQLVLAGVLLFFYLDNNVTIVSVLASIALVVGSSAWLKTLVHEHFLHRWFDDGYQAQKEHQKMDKRDVEMREFKRRQAFATDEQIADHFQVSSYEVRHALSMWRKDNVADDPLALHVDARK